MDLRPAWMAMGVLVVACSASDLRDPFSLRSDPIAAIGKLRNFAGELAELKTARDIQTSFLVEASDLFFPGGVAEDPGALPALSAQQLKAIEAFLDERIVQTYERVDVLFATHPAFATFAGQKPRFRSLRLETHNYPDAEVSADGVVYFDVRVLQSLIRAVIIEWARAQTESYDALRGDERTMIRRFNAYMAEVKSAAPTMRLSLYGHLLKGSKNSTFERAAPTLRKDDDSFVERMIFGPLEKIAARGMDGLLEALEDKQRLEVTHEAQERLQSGLDFVFAHELAHRAFGHNDQRVMSAPPSEATCAMWSQQELTADEFALVVLLAGQVKDAVAMSMTKTSVFEERYSIDTMRHVPVIDGYRTFLTSAYGIAGFNGRFANGCAYPSVDVRTRKLSGGELYVEGALDEGLGYVTMVHRSLTSSRDPRNYPAVLKAASERYVASAKQTKRPAPPEDLPRWRELVDPLLQQRFEGAI